MAIPRNVQHLINRWREIQTRGGQLDHDVAIYARDVHEAYPVWDQFWEFFSETLGERETATVKKYASMAEAVCLVTDPAVWRAVGWREVRNIVRIENGKALQAACARIVQESQRKKSAKVGATIVDKILVEESPETFLPKAPVPETPADKKLNKAEAEKKAAPHKDRAEILAKAIRRLVEGRYAFLADELTTEERQAAGLRSVAKRARAS